MQPHIPEKLTPSDVSQMLIDLNHFTESSIGRLLAGHYAARTRQIMEQMACAISKNDYTNAHESLGAANVLKEVCSDSQGNHPELFPGLSKHLQKQIDERRAKAQK